MIRVSQHIPTACSLMLATGVLLAGCAAPQPRGTLSQELARITLETRPQDRIEAYRLDGTLVDGLRFDDLAPGNHDLRVRYYFEIPGSAGGAGSLGESRWERCILGVRYAGFDEGQDYIFQAQPMGFRASGSLRSASGEKLAAAQVIRCGPAA